MGEKNSIAAEAKFYVETGHLELTRFELVVDGKQLSTLDTRQDVRSKQIPRILRIFHEYSRTGHVKLPKKQAPWNKLWGFLRKVYKKEVSKPAWYKAMFQEADLQLLFPDNPAKSEPRKSYFPFNSDRFPASAVTVSIRKDDSPNGLSPQEVGALLDELSQKESPKGQVSVDRHYAIYLASELQVPNLVDDDERVVIGKAIWLSRLALLRDLVQAELLSDAGHIGRLRKILNSRDPQSDWTSYCQMLWTGSCQAAASWGLIPSMNLTP